MEALLILGVGVLAIWLVNRSYNRSWSKPGHAFPQPHKAILLQWVPFYEKLNRKGRQHFEYKVQEFLQNVTITGIETAVDTTDRLLVASSAVIPIFAFPDWIYTNLDEVLLYPSSLNLDFDTTGKGRPILGMVGNGYMERKMILSRRALRQGFQNETDKRNTSIHEFVHLIDKADGQTDGIPSVLLERQYTIPWVDMVEQKIEEIIARESDIDPYGSTSRTEFFAVIAEYFFERPQLLKKKHPKLYAWLCEIFIP